MKKQNEVNTKLDMKRVSNSMLGLNIYGKELTQAEIDRNMHRLMVGGAWDKYKNLQCDFLVTNGLKPFHNLLDIACGCMRGGISCIKYLDPGNYYGFDVNNSLVKAGKIEIEKAGLNDRNPHLLVDGSFQINKFNMKFDFMVSVSLFTHLPMNNIIRCLSAVKSNLKPDGVYFSSFWEAPAQAYLENIQFPEGVFTTYDSDPFHYAFEDIKWMADIAGLQATYIGDWGHPRNQKMAAFRHKADSTLKETYFRRFDVDSSEEKKTPINSVIPQKLREVQNHSMDSTQWNEFKYRDDDIVIASWAKAGTTWIQQIVGQLIFGGKPDLEIRFKSLYLESHWPTKSTKLEHLSRQSHRRFIKTHLPVDALLFSQKAKYIYIGRNAPDIVWSLYSHLMNFKDDVFDAVEKLPEGFGPSLKRPTIDFHEFWHQWLHNDGYPMYPFWEHVRSWWKIRELPFIKIIHFECLKEDMEREILGIAEFLGISVTPEQMDRICEYCSFDWMKKNPYKTVPIGMENMTGGASTFYQKGLSGQWQDYLSSGDIAEYKQYAIDELGLECANWLFGSRGF